MSEPIERTVDGHPIRLTSPDRVVYPSTGMTKLEVFEYYLEVAPALIPLATDRPVTRKRWLQGVGTAKKPGPHFFHKDIDDDAPEWFTTHQQKHRDHSNTYPIIDSPAVLAWYVQRGTLEFHVPQWRFGPRGARRKPDRLVIDLDPGEGAGLEECVQVATLVRDRLAEHGIETCPATSGSKGVHIYGRLDGSLTSDAATALAKELAEGISADAPDLATANIRKAQREGKVLLDWSQNRAAKTTVTPYSLRGRVRPWVAVPRTWEELLDPALEQLEYTSALKLLKRRPCPLLTLTAA